MSQIAKFSGIFKFELVRVTQRKKLLMMILFIGISPLIAGYLAFVWQGEHDLERAYSLYFNVGLRLFVEILVPLYCLLLGTSLIREEMEEGSLIYILSTTSSRGLLLIGKYLTNLVLLLVAIALGVLAIATVCIFTVSPSKAFNPSLWMPLTTTAMATAFAFFSLFTLLGLFFRRALVGGIVYLVVIEFIFSRWLSDFVVKKLSLTYYARNMIDFNNFSLLSNYSQLQGNLAGKFNSAVPFHPLWALLGVGLVGIAISVFWFYFMEAETIHREGD